MEQAPGDRNARGPHNSVGTTATTVARPDPLGTGQRGHRISRWARKRLDELEERPAGVEPAWPPPCSRWHPGPCDYWAACSGMHLSIAGREALATAVYGARR